LPLTVSAPAAGRVPLQKMSPRAAPCSCKPTSSGPALWRQPCEHLWDQPCPQRRLFLALRCGSCSPRQASIWAVVCAAAVEAMDWGHRYLWALAQGCKEAEEDFDPTQPLITAFFPVVPPAQPAAPIDQPSNPVHRASRRAVVQFWRLVQDFVSLASVPIGWQKVAAYHPFLGVEGAGGQVALRLNLPPGVSCDPANCA
jgi:hypothetical protein